MGADGPGKAEIAVEELARVRVFCDDWEQASHNGDLAHAVEAGAIARDDVTQLGDVLAGTAEGRRSDDEITVFDSTGLAIQGPRDRARGDGARGRARSADDRPLEVEREERSGRSRSVPLASSQFARPKTTTPMFETALGLLF